MSVLFAVTVAMVSTVMVTVVGSGGKEGLFRHVVGGVSEDTVLHVSAQETLLGEGDSVLESIVSPAVHPAEEKRSLSLASHVLIQVELEEFLGSSASDWFHI